MYDMSYLTLDPIHQHTYNIVLFRLGKNLPRRYVMPLFKTASTAAGSGVLCKKYGVSLHRGLLSVISGILGGQAFGNKVLRMALDSIYPLFGYIRSVFLRKRQRS